MKKVYDVILVLLFIGVVITSILIIKKYGGNRINEKDIASTLEIIQSKFEENSEDNPIDIDYKGYKVEGIIEIPSINIKYPILNETKDDSMKISITKFWGPEINQIGNYTVSGHNNKDGTMFGKTKRLNVGDIIKLTDLKNHTVDYKIFDIYTIGPDDVSVVESVYDNTREVTLITCTNGHKNRLIIKAKEVIE